MGTHGRGFWILDDISPLRQLTAEIAAGGAYLFAPRPAWRFNRNTNTDTPLPPEEPAGKNPPDGAILYYWLPSDAKAPVTLEILDSTGKVLRKYSSADKPEPPSPTLNIPTYWIRPAAILAAKAGMHRFVWDLHAERRWRARRVSDFGDLYGYAGRARRMDAAGNVSCAAYGGWAADGARDRGEAGSPPVGARFSRAAEATVTLASFGLRSLQGTGDKIAGGTRALTPSRYHRRHAVAHCGGAVVRGTLRADDGRVGARSHRGLLRDSDAVREEPGYRCRVRIRESEPVRTASTIKLPICARSSIR